MTEARGATVRRIAPQAYDALIEGLTHVYWYKPDFERFLRAELADSPELVVGLSFGAPKRQTATSLIEKLRRNEQRYQGVTLHLLLTLADFDDAFSHLARLDDSDTKLARARGAVAEVRRWTARYRERLDEQQEAAKQRHAAAREAELQRSFTAERERLRVRFGDLTTVDDTVRRGRALEPLLNDLFLLYDLTPRAPFALSGEQIDGAFTFDTDDFLLEARWRREPSSPEQLTFFSDKVAGKTHTTRGLFTSINGFTRGAVERFTGRGTRILLADGTDLYLVLEGRLSLDEVLLRKRRHAAETGEPFYSVREML